MAELAKRETVGNGGVEDEEAAKLLEGVAVLDFDVLCSTVAMQTQGKAIKLNSNDEYEEGGGEFGGGVLRMWEGELLHCFEDHRIALQSTCCPCSRFGKNMRRAGFGSCFLQGMIYFILAATVIFNCIAFIVSKRRSFLYLCVAFTISLGTYVGFYRTQIRKKFNIRESRTLEMNNVQDGTWHGRGDTICIGGFGEGSKPCFQLHPPPVMSTKSPEPNSMQKTTNASDHAWTPEVSHSVLLVPPSR
ncbi:uncharacterized protein LOC132266674 isoform X2 [Cornus florida]|uniref:uncharacterized protein LOC132266674 isoform X2 n=1 Tax=Cornus florida TaxID=4283 RepID=UPI0028A15987|nr:uncharacterized protein LOC132266674 isoform X2 [Cornus florida]